jgi:RNA polymerase sigma-70 factor (ECF subfamily)
MGERTVTASQGGIGSIEQLHDDFAGPLYLYAWRRLGDRRAAEETVQDTLVRAWRNAHRFDPDRGSLPAWLFTIARNVTTDTLRRRGARPVEVPVTEDGGDPLADGDIDRILEAWQSAEALHGLTTEHREAIIDVRHLGFTVREVAGRRGVPEGTVKSRLYYGLRALRLQLEEMGVTR